MDGKSSVNTTVESNSSNANLAESFGENVYVHCAAGGCRSVTAVVIYLMAVLNVSACEACWKLNHLRWVHNVREQFLYDLKKREKEIWALREKVLVKEFGASSVDFCVSFLEAWFDFARSVVRENTFGEDGGEKISISGGGFRKQYEAQIEATGDQYGEESSVRILGDRGYLFRGADLQKVQSWHDAKMILMLRETIESGEARDGVTGRAVPAIAAGDLDAQLIAFLGAKAEGKDVGAKKKRSSAFESAQSAQ